MWLDWNCEIVRDSDWGEDESTLKLDVNGKEYDRVIPENLCDLVNLGWTKYVQDEVLTMGHPPMAEW